MGLVVVIAESEARSVVDCTLLSCGRADRAYQVGPLVTLHCPSSASDRGVLVSGLLGHGWMAYCFVIAVVNVRNALDSRLERASVIGTIHSKDAYFLRNTHWIS